MRANEPQILVFSDAIGDSEGAGQFAERRLFVGRRFEAGQPRALQVVHDFADVEADDGAIGAGYLHFAVERFDNLPLESPCPASANEMPPRPSSQGNLRASARRGSEGHAVELEVGPCHQHFTCGVERQKASPTATVEFHVLNRDLADAALQRQGQAAWAGLYVLVGEAPRRQSDIGIEQTKN